MQLLCQYQADVETPTCIQRYNQSHRPLEIALQWGGLKRASILLRHGANPNKPNQHGQTALHLVAKHYSAEQIKSLGSMDSEKAAQAEVEMSLQLVKELLAHQANLTLVDKMVLSLQLLPHISL